MGREKVVRLILLTVCIFAFSMYMQKGTWVFPFPLYESMMVFSIVALMVADKRRPGPLPLLSLVWASMQLAVAPFILEFFITEQNADWLFESLYLDLMKLGGWLLFLLWGVFATLQLKRFLLTITGIVLLSGFVALTVLNEALIACVPLTMWLLLFYPGQKQASIERNTLFLFTFFFLSHQLTYFFLVH